jgi:hypothetical protein
MNASILSRAALVIALLPLSGCVSPQPQPSRLCEIGDSGGPAIPESFVGTMGRTRKRRAVQHVVMVPSVETGTCRGFDRVVIDFAGHSLPPQYTVEYVNGPIKACRSGETVSISGTAKLKISFDQAQAHTPEGQPLFADHNRRLSSPNLKHLVVACDFEGLVEIVLGLDARRPYRVVELLNDSKLVLDVKH